jgi:hypothetical protein
VCSKQSGVKQRQTTVTLSGYGGIALKERELPLAGANHNEYLVLRTIKPVKSKQ